MEVIKMNISHIIPRDNIQAHNFFRQKVEMYLTHQVLANPETYSKVHPRHVVQNLAYPKVVNEVRMIDNSAYELSYLEGKSACTLEQVLEAAEIIDATEIVLPDIPRSIDSVYVTMDAVREARRLGWKGHMMGVVQGNTIAEYLNCFHILNECKQIDILGIPKYVADMDNMGFGRAHFINTISQHCQKPIHLLGLKYSIAELALMDLTNVRSMDTSHFCNLVKQSTQHEDANFIKIFGKRDVTDESSDLDGAVDMYKLSAVRFNIDVWIEELK